MPRSKNRHTRRAQKARRRTRERERNYAREALSAPGCPTPDKAAFKTRAEAQSHLGRLWSMKGAPPGKLPCRVYRCPCGMFHLTSKPRSAPTGG